MTGAEGMGQGFSSLLVHAVLTALAMWPALRILDRAGLPARWAVWLVLPFVGMAVFATLLAFRPWPKVPPPAPRLHPRERARRQKEAADALAVSE